MKRFFFPSICLLGAFLFSCAGQEKSMYIPVPDEFFFEQEQKKVELDIITETRDGVSVENMPPWMYFYASGGIEAVERIGSYNGKYVFIGNNEGENFDALGMWVDNFSAVRDFTMLAADRIERRIISASTMYPEYEYGSFYETMVKKAYSSIYSGAVKEDTYWVKMKVGDENDDGENGSRLDNAGIYYFFVLITIEKGKMQAAVTNMIAESLASVTPTETQRNAIIRLQQRFFERF
ncbi:MAG: hypothetical protein LBI12_02050 [Treponema sp.]|jgi:hypothetical protein|nr:hypothetical protein [Treponema sp.]